MTMRKLVLALAVLLVLAAAGGYLQFRGPEYQVKSAIEQSVAKVTGLPVAVGSVKLSLKDGKGEVERLTIGNPPEFKSAYLVRFPLISVAFDKNNPSASPLVLQLVDLSAAELIYEVGPAGSNLDILRKRVADWIANPPSDRAVPADKGRKLVVDHLVQKGVKLTFATPTVSGKASFALPDILLDGIGKGGSGAMPTEFGAQFLDAVGREAVVGEGTIGIGDLVNGLTLPPGQPVDMTGTAAEKPSQ